MKDGYWDEHDGLPEIARLNIAPDLSETQREMVRQWLSRISALYTTPTTIGLHLYSDGIRSLPDMYERREP